MLIGMMLALQQKRQEDHRPLRVLFLCRHDSARAPLAAALLRAICHGTIEVSSAGSEPAQTLHPCTVQLLARLGVDLDKTVPTHLAQVRDQRFDLIISLCDEDHEICPVFPGDPSQIRWAFPDPVNGQDTPHDASRLFEQLSLQLSFRLRLLHTVLERTPPPRGG